MVATDHHGGGEGARGEWDLPRPGAQIVWESQKLGPAKAG